MPSLSPSGTSFTLEFIQAIKDWLNVRIAAKKAFVKGKTADKNVSLLH
jgi:hypothetical protein